MENLETVVMQIITYAGNAKSLCMEALAESREGNVESAQNLLKEADESLLIAHKMQMDLLVDEANDKQIEMTLLMVHAQDHYMNAQTTRDLIDEIINMNKRINDLYLEVNKK